jgi:cytochrome P450
MNASVKSMRARMRPLKHRFASLRRQWWALTARSPDANAVERNLNLLDPWIIQNPYPYYEVLRKQSSVHFLKQQGIWLVLDYEDVAGALKQPQVFSNSPRHYLDPFLVGADPPEHTRARQYVTPNFSNKELSNLNGYIEESACRLLAQALCKQPHFDIVSDFAIPLAEFAFARMLGLTDDAITTLRQAAASKAYDAEYFQKVELFFSDYLSIVHGKDGENLCTRLVSRSETSSFTKKDIAGMLAFHWAAATATTRMVISTCTHILLQNGDLFSELRNNQELLPQFIEEALRFDSPTQTIWRRTVEKTALAGVSIPANAEVRLCLGAANRDPKHYENPDQFLLHRNPKDHLAFGAGPHYCLGAGLTRSETLIALRVLIEKCPGLKLANTGHAIHYEAHADSRALKSLPVVAEAQAH